MQKSHLKNKLKLQVRACTFCWMPYGNTIRNPVFMPFSFCDSFCSFVFLSLSRCFIHRFLSLTHPLHLSPSLTLFVRLFDGSCENKAFARADVSHKIGVFHSVHRHSLNMSFIHPVYIAHSIFIIMMCTSYLIQVIVNE